MFRKKAIDDLSFKNFCPYPEPQTLDNFDII